jgi:hypothetical protein
MPCSSVSGSTPTQPAAQSTATSAQKPAQSTTPFATPTDSVQLSSAAQATLAALKEITENPSQTATEAGKGDLQAQKLLTTEAAAKSATK